MDQRLVTSWVVGLFDGAEDFGDGTFFMVIFWQWWQGNWALWLGFHRWFSDRRVCCLTWVMWLMGYSDLMG